MSVFDQYLNLCHSKMFYFRRVYGIYFISAQNEWMSNLAKRAQLGTKTRLHVLHICNPHFVRNSCIRQHCRNIEAVIQTNFR